VSFVGGSLTPESPSRVTSSMPASRPSSPASSSSGRWDSIIRSISPRGAGESCRSR